MSSELSPIDTAKFVAAKQATEYVESGMKVGLGTGSTAAWLVQCLGEMVRDEGLKIKGVPTSSRTAKLARQVGIEGITLDEARWLDVTIDGTDEYEDDLCLIKGGGGEFERHAAKDIAAFGLRHGAHWEKTLPALREETRRLAEEPPLEGERLYPQDGFQTAIVTGTAALALDTLGVPDSQTRADALWARRRTAQAA